MWLSTPPAPPRPARGDASGERDGEKTRLFRLRYDQLYAKEVQLPINTTDQSRSTGIDYCRLSTHAMCGRHQALMIINKGSNLAPNNAPNIAKPWDKTWESKQMQHNYQF